MAVSHQSLMTFLRDDLGVDITEVTDVSPLFSSGVIDSFSLVTLLAHIESTCGIRISSADVNLDNFDSISRIVAFVERMTSGSTGT